LINVNANGIFRQKNSRVINFSSVPNRNVLGRINVNKLKKKKDFGKENSIFYFISKTYFVLNLSSNETKRVNRAIYLCIIITYLSKISSIEE
jgi:hypothetical protein